MRLGVPNVALALTALVALGACQDPDVGNPCVLDWASDWQVTGSPPPPTPDSLYQSGGSDYFETFDPACDNLVCIVSPVASGERYGSCTGDACGYCSKPCVSNDDCYQSETGLVCDQILPDPVFLATLDEATKSRYLAGIEGSSYCVVPRR